jgi:hypothetical protein
MLPSRTDLLNTVQSFPPSTTMGGMLFAETRRGAFLPTRGSKERDRILRLYDTDENNTLWQGTRSGFSKKVASVEYSIDGPPDITQYFHDLLGNAHLGRGWQHFIKLCVRDYLSQSYGCVIEIAGYGEAWEPLPKDLPITGINHLDAGRCYFTGNPVYPVIYYSLWDGKLHKMHADRVYVLVDDPDPDERYFGIGTCALERAIAVAQREIRMAQYIETKLDDKPNPGVNVWTNIAEGQFDQKIAKFMTDMQNDERPIFGRTLNLFSLDPSNKAEMTSVPFSNPPDKFDFTQYVSLDVDMLALAFGTDRQEIWQLTGGNIGSSGQSEVLAEKSRGKTFGDFLTSLERFLNWAILPEECEAKLSDNDERKAKAQAEIDNLYAGIASQLSSVPGVSPEMILKMLVDKSATYKDAFTNEQGQIVLPIRDQYTPQQAVSLDAVTPAPEQASAAQESPQDQQDREQLDNTKDFNPSQPRDGEGQWSETGAGGGLISIGGQQVSRDVLRRALQMGGDVPTSSDPSSDQTRRANETILAAQQEQSSIAQELNTPKGFKRHTGYDKTDIDRVSGAAELGIKPKYRIEKSKSGKIEKIVVDGGDTLKRTLHFKDGKPDYIHNDHFYMPKDKTGSGRGTKVFKSQVDQAASMGFKRIETVGGKSEYMNGYYTWPRLGYDAPVPIENPFKAKRLSDLMTTKEGRNWWRQNGKQISMSFSLSGKSRSRKVLDAYYREKFGSKAWRFKQDDGVDDAPILSPEDEALLDNIWDTIDFSDTEDEDRTESKAFNGTSANFKLRFIDIVTLAIEKRLSPAEFDTLMLASLERAGRDAYIDGLKQGGVSQMDETDEAELQRWVSDQIDFIDNLKAQVYSDGISAVEVPARADMWQNKSLSTMYDAGRVSADRNGMYIWKLGGTEKHCNDCIRLNGQVHRFKDWYSRDWLPQSDRLSCNGFNCDCKLEKTTEPARGRF